MPLNVVYNNNNYTIPLPGETYAWGGPLTSYFQALGGSLATGTGTFNLTQPLDFGPSFGIETLSVQTNFVDFVTNGNAALAQRLVWNTATNSLLLGMNSNVAIQVGQDNVVLARNTTGSTIPRGAIVRLSGSLTNRPLISLASNTTIVTSSFLAVTAESIADASNGFVLTRGTLRNTDTSAFVEGDTLWLGTGGAFTKTLPVAPAQVVAVGIVTNANASLGSILIGVQQGESLNRLSDVTVTSPTLGQALVYDGTSKFINGTPAYPTTQVVTPLTGGTTTMTVDDNLLFNLGATIATHTVTLPAGPVTANRIVRITLATTGAFNITALTVNASVAVRNPPTTLTPGIGCSFIFANSVWNRLY